MISGVQWTLVFARKALGSTSDITGWLQPASRVAFKLGQMFLALMVSLAPIGGWAQDGQASLIRGDEGNKTIASAPDDPKTSATTATVPAEPSYVIGVDDTLLVSVWKEPDLTTTVPVRADGMISVPLLDDVQAAGLTPMQLGALLKGRLKKYVSDPRVTVVVTRTDSHRIYVLGEVLHSGAISLLHRMTVLQALATAGFSEYANTKKIYILRKNNGQEQKIPFNYKQVIRGQEVSKDIQLEPGDMIVVP